MMLARTGPFLFAATLLFATTVFAAQPESYAQPELLIEAAELKAALEKSAKRPLKQAQKVSEEELANRGRGEFVLIDVRPRADYNRGTIGRARHIDAREWGAAFGRGDDAEAWGKRLAPLFAPTGSKAAFVVFDNAVTPTACRTWWMLKYWGVDDVRVLNGGMKAWQAAGGALDLAPKAFVRAEAGKLTPVGSRLISADRVKKILLDRKRNDRLLDARTEREFAAGAIPTASNLDWQRLVDRATGKFRPAADLQALLDERGVDLREPIITYCRSGKRSSVLAFALELMGAKQVANYYGSWNEWSRLPGAPIARPLAGAGR